MKRRRLAAALAPIALLASASPAAATVTVDNNGDAKPVPGDCTAAPNDCSLRQAIAAASPHETIAIPASVGTIAVGSQLRIKKPVVIRGAGQDKTIVTGQDKTRVIRIDSSFRVTLAKLRISHGRATVAKQEQGGAGIFVDHGPLKLDHVRVTHNSLTATGGVVASLPAIQGGAGVYSNDRLEIRDSQINLNTLDATNPDSSGKGGGGVLAHGSLLVVHSDVTENKATLAGKSVLGGGGVMYLGTDPALLVETDVNGNEADVQAGDGHAGGGGIFGGDVTLVRSAVVGNQLVVGGATAVGGGGVFVEAAHANLVNSTVGRNHLAIDVMTPHEVSGGGALYLETRDDQGAIEFRNSTLGPDIVFGFDSVEIVNNGSASPTLLNTIVKAAGDEDTCRVEPGAGSFVSLGHNLENNDQCGLHAAGDEPNTNVDLDTEQFGPTTASAPYTANASNVVNRGDSSQCPRRDQRGVRRPQGNGCDIGAVEILVPKVKALPPELVEAHKARVAAKVVSDVAGGARVRVDYGLTKAYGKFRKIGGIPGGTETARVPLDGLQASTTYHYRFVVTSAAGTAVTPDQTFTTKPG